jgi:hypothetical protein
MTAIRIAHAIVIASMCAGCASDVYLRDGVTDGDTFYLSQRALAEDDPAYQSWVRYSLVLSTCQLQIGGDNPARATSYDCELRARRNLVEAWREKTALDPELSNRYLDSLASVDSAGFLGEYVAHYHARDEWTLPPDLDGPGFTRWRRDHLAGHRSRTHLTGSWNYARNTSAAGFR